MSTPLRDLPAQRRQTYAFLRDARNTCHVHLLADVDVTALRRARGTSAERTSYVSYVVKAAADAIAANSDARTVLRDGLRPRLATIEDVHAKVLFDKTVDGQRCVLSGSVESAQGLGVADIQRIIDDHKKDDATPGGPFAQVRRLQRLPLPLVRVLYKAVLRDPRRRARLQGTFSVTSVGHEPVRAILPMIGGTWGFGIGTITDTPVVRDGEVVVRPVLTLSLTFDHRVVDGALAAELLGEVKHGLENWT
ncbi:dehydrogenase [Nocardiopsis sp. TSRI0078]|uniref:2-oxo acid dehydrogenase subunit E2 n=1 Tax=unclassified Nocardiopsis TaxID=2649073 RepID=UPI00093AD88B|nr:2-oxo acid dehydrogenase subunit E2 [Nocardiopsis sp. TSRI0078]OKI13018.1 dehydrogenase [Nocardiopsis sp. TSRI0078]